MRLALVWFVRNVRRVLKGRVPREDATRRIEEVLRRLDRPTPHLIHVSRLVVYGSYARGALRVGDVDLAIDYDGKDMFDRAAVDDATKRLAAAREAVEAVAPALAADPRARAKILAADAARLRRQLGDGLPPPTQAIYDPLRQPPPQGNAAAVVDNAELSRLEIELQAACDQFDDAVTRRLPFPPGTPTLAPVANLKQMIEELRGGGDRVSIYCFGADMPYDRATDNPQNKYWVWHLLWERGDALALALQRLHAIKPDPEAGRAPRSGQTGPGFKT